MTTSETKPALNILVVDDDLLVREATVWMLADAGHTVHEASDGVMALEFLLTHGPVDLLIADINMPRMDGLSLVRQVRLQWPSLPVLLVSGRPQPPGTQTFMPKPFGWDTLLRAVSRVVDAAAAERAQDARVQDGRVEAEVPGLLSAAPVPHHG